jgi:hypothetical protein
MIIKAAVSLARGNRR